MVSNPRTLVLSLVLTAVALLGFSTPSFAQDNENVLAQLSGTSEMTVERSKWGVSYFNFSSSDMAGMNRGGASWSIYQYLSLNYYLDYNQKISLRPTFITNTAGYDAGGNAKQLQTQAHDFALTYSNYSLASFPGEWDLSGTFYLYAPTSQSAQDKRWAAHVASWLIFTKVLDRNWALTYNMKPHYWFNTQKAYRKTSTRTFPDGGSSTRIFAENNQMAELTHYLELSRYWNRIFTPQLAVGFTHEWYTDSDQADSRPAVQEYLTVQPSTWIFVNRKLKFIAGVSNQVNIRDRRGEPFRLFREEDNQYYIMTFWSLM
jgi:hypothetical protein